MEVVYFIIRFLFALVLIVLLIILLIRQGNIQKELSILTFNFSQISSKLTRLAESIATKDDLQAIKDLLADTSVKQTDEMSVQPDSGQSEIVENTNANAADITSDKMNQWLQTAVDECSVKNIETPQTSQTMSVDSARKGAIGSVRVDAEDMSQQQAEPVASPQFTTPPPRNEPKEKGFFAKLFTENWLTKIGIITLVLGIAFFVKYAIEQNWINEIGRVAIGILTGAILIGIAQKLRKGYDVFAAILAGGGIAVFYFTITLAFREYGLFSQPVAFALLIGITVLSVVFSLLYNRKELAIFSLLGGFASPLMISTGGGHYIVLFTFILILNTGMLVLSFRKNWHILGTLCYVLTAIFYLSWLATSFHDQVVGGIILAILFFVQFYLLALIDIFRSGQKLSVYQTVILLSNNLLLLIACLVIFGTYTPDLRGVSVVGIALFNAVVMIILSKKKSIDRNFFYLLIAIVLSLVTLAVPIQLEGNAITMFWAVEAVVLLWLWQRSAIRTFCVGFIGLSVLLLISYAIDLASFMREDTLFVVIILNKTFVTGVVIVLSYLANIWFLQKEKQDIVFGFSPLTFGRLTRIFKVLFVVMTYVVIYAELRHQLVYYTDVPYGYWSDIMVSNFSSMAMFAYTGLYVALLTIVVPRSVRNSPIVYGILYVFVIIYSIVFVITVPELRKFIFSHAIYPPSYFTIHFVVLAALVVMVRFMILRCKSMSGKRGVLFNFTAFSWIMSVLSVVVLSTEAVNIAEFIFGNEDNYYFIEYQVNSFVLPVVWGLIAMTLMIWGLRAREVVLRQISLVFFAIIIVKFYIYDVWHMSQAGRIVSFVFLGVILLVVSFMQQKIKTWVKDDSGKSKIDNEKE